MTTKGTDKIYHKLNFVVRCGVVLDHLVTLGWFLGYQTKQDSQNRGKRIIARMDNKIKVSLAFGMCVCVTEIIRNCELNRPILLQLVL